MLRIHFVFQICLLAHLLSKSSAKFDYCSVTCKEGAIRQIVCERGSNCSLPVYGCYNYQNATLSQEEKQSILDQHNTLRSLVALGKTNFSLKYITAANMNELSWDEELETFAICWVNTCGLYDLNNICLGTASAKSGYNIAFKRTSVPKNELRSNETLHEHITGWYSEVEGFSEESVDKYPADILQRKLKHFSQLAWAETSRIGCARAIYGQYITMFACVYNPTGNVDDQHVFIKGVPCSKCKFGTCSKTYQGLCQEVLPTSAKSIMSAHSSTAKTLSKIPLLGANVHRQKHESEEEKFIDQDKSIELTFIENSNITTNINKRNNTKLKSKHFKLPRIILNPKKEIREVRELGNGTEEVSLYNEGYRNDNMFVKDFGVFVIGMMIIFK